MEAVMLHLIPGAAAVVLLLASSLSASGTFEADTIRTSAGPLRITFIGHASLMFQFGGKVIQIDPYGKLADYSKFPTADLVIITHEHPDHLDTEAIKKVSTDRTTIVCTPACAKEGLKGIVMKNGDAQTVLGIKIEAVPAYNIVHKRPDGAPFHPPGVGNGYVLTVGDKRIYVAGDTENIPEMKDLTNVDVAFLPMNLPYTMTPEMVAEAARSFMPKILYPYHFGDTDTRKIVALLASTPSIDVRIRKMK
jgi:L-ascorbate metabolism protein UlaG (beta-lactamase superfamily)